MKMATFYFCLVGVLATSSYKFSRSQPYKDRDKTKRESDIILLVVTKERRSPMNESIVILIISLKKQNAVVITTLSNTNVRVRLLVISSFRY